MLQLQRSRTSFRGTPGFTERKDLPEEPELRRTDKVKKAESDPHDTEYQKNPTKYTPTSMFNCLSDRTWIIQRKYPRHLSK